MTFAAISAAPNSTLFNKTAGEIPIDLDTALPPDKSGRNASPRSRVGAQSPDGMRVAALPVAAGGAVLTTAEALIIGGILGTAVIGWWANENQGVIRDAAANIKQNLDDVSALLSNVNVEYVAPTQKEIEARITKLFVGIKQGLTKAGQNIWSAPGAVKQMIQQGIDSIVAPGQQTAQNAPNRPPPTSSRPQTSTPGTPSAQPSRTAPDPIQTPRTRTVPPVLAVPTASPSLTPAQVNQRQAAGAATATLVRSNPVVNQLNTAIDRYYQVSAGGQAARKSGALKEPLQSITQANQQLTKLINESNSQIAASSPEAKPGLTQRRSELMQAGDAVRDWLPAANAFAAGKSGPGGKVTANLALPPPPSAFASPSNSGVSAQQVSDAISRDYERASSALDRGASQTAAAKTATTQSNAATAAAQKQASNDRAAAELLKSATAITPRMNSGVQSFYQQAAGGLAARKSGALKEPVRQVLEARNELASLIKQADTKLASGTGKQQSLGALRDNLVSALQATDAWLPQAHKFAAGLDATGKAASRPTLPKPPAFVSSPADSQAGAGPTARQLSDAYKAAGAALTNGAVQPTRTTAMPAPSTVVGSRNTKAVPANQIDIVSKMPADVTRVAKVWINPSTGEASATEKKGGGWVQAMVGQSNQMSTGGLGKPNPVPDSSGQTGGSGETPNYYHVEVKGDYNDNRGGGGKDPKDKTGLILGAIGALLGGGSLVFQAIQWRSSENATEAQMRAQEADRKESAWQPDTTLAAPFLGATDPKSTYKNTSGVDLSSPDKKASAIVSLWKAYFDQIPAALKKNGVHSPETESKFKAQADSFITNLQASQVRLKQASTPEAKSQVVAAMSAQRFPDMNFSKAGDTSALGVRRAKTMQGLISAMNVGAGNGLATIQSAPEPQSKLPTAAAGTKTPMTPQQFQDTKINEILRQTAPTAVSGTPTVPTTAPASPKVAATPPPTQAAYPTARKDAPAKVPTVKPQAPAQSEQSKRAFADVNKLLQAAGLPLDLNATPQSPLNFKAEMFLKPGKQNDYQEVLKAYDKAYKLFNDIRAIHTRSDRDVGLQINTQLLMPLNKVINQLAVQGDKLQKLNINQ